ncbi:MAG TPA: BON domain-containing protein [Chromatiaceae bacterium]|jgi:osmotically-inducible protein OsmY|nr:BON domain-containing protein [Chromatiaceae bacterium]HIN82165.1 BON domain-containing protein [Chromatiales bacterium]HIA08728.1 BON domain-containing protein [Chromatiaceae bacterium]HIB85582.1 BON domain-containing protein [Chromatiaceae bacterium]HIO15019.1 BON domain-containing protein [Chromatiales bacterium]
MITRQSTLILIVLLGLLQGCATALVGGVAAGTAVVTDRRSMDTMVDDEGFELNALKAMFQDKTLYNTSHVNVTSYNQIVLLSGEAPSNDLRQRAERLIRGLGTIRKLHNQITIAAPSAMSSRASDTLITAHIKTAMLISSSLSPVSASRVKVITENGTVFLMGILNATESDAAVEIARNVGGVQRVVPVFDEPGAL